MRIILSVQLVKSNSFELIWASFYVQIIHSHYSPMSNRKNIIILNKHKRKPDHILLYKESIHLRVFVWEQHP